MPKVHHNIEIPNTRREGQTGIYRNSKLKGDLLVTYKKNVHTLYDVWQDAYPRVRHLNCMGYRPIINPLTDERSSEYNWETYEQVAGRADCFGAGLRQLVEETTDKTSDKQSPIGIWAINRPEWGLTDIACVSYGFYSVSLYDTLGDGTYVINHSELEVVVCSSDHIGHLLETKSKCPVLKVIISMDPLTEYNNGGALAAWAKEKGVLLYDFGYVESLGQQQQPRRPHIPPQPTDLAFILYTSGTTGQPKGAMLTHANVLATLTTASTVYNYRFGQETMLSYLPSPHIFGRALDWTIWAYGGQVGYFSGSVDTLLQDIQILKPTVFGSVPRLLNRIYSKLTQATVNAPGTTGALFRQAYKTKLSALRQHKGVTHPLWDRLLFNKVKQVLGGEIRVVITGSAPIAGEVMEYLKLALCVDIKEVYGSTENGGCGTGHQDGEYRVGHVGAATVSSEIKLVDVPEMNYFATDPQPRGEICTRGPSTFLGYYKDEEKTRETLIDGWLYTGDIGMMDCNNNLVIIDRKKNIFKLAQGEYIAPEKIENILMNDSLVLQAFVYGDSLQSKLVAIIVPDPELLVPLGRKLGVCDGKDLSMDALHDLCRNPIISKYLLNHLTQVTKRGGLKGFEQPKAIHLEAEPFSIESGILTPTMKLKRPQAKELYEGHIQAMYQHLENETPKAML
ncbi:hypothetical protein BCR42DRAFT_380417 [Absidia repens]|uniref:AMP-dependent synthetase/ligase domain-containing protein n=1 Tax=Absidia repens TaxID=90262 RepID=A0A1X2I736_9FUNG|nr:hypothetical protein BCR42DRAFT_380417 [Absidia repens]